MFTVASAAGKCLPLEQSIRPFSSQRQPPFPLPMGQSTQPGRLSRWRWTTAQRPVVGMLWLFSCGSRSVLMLNSPLGERRDLPPGPAALSLAPFARQSKLAASMWLCWFCLRPAFVPSQFCPACAGPHRVTTSTDRKSMLPCSQRECACKLGFAQRWCWVGSPPLILFFSFPV